MEKPVCYNNVIHSESSRLKIPKVLDWNVNSQRKCIYSPFIVTFMWIHLETVKVINLVRNLWKLFGGIPKIGFLSIQLRAQASISLYIKKNIKKKILSEVAIFNMDVIKSYHVNYYQCQLSYQGWKIANLWEGSTIAKIADEQSIAIISSWMPDKALVSRTCLSIDSCKKAFSQTLIVIGNCQLHSSAKRHLTVFHSSRFEEHLATEKFVNLQQFNFSTVVSKWTKSNLNFPFSNRDLVT